MEAKRTSVDQRSYPILLSLPYYTCFQIRVLLVHVQKLTPSPIQAQRFRNPQDLIPAGIEPTRKIQNSSPVPSQPLSPYPWASPAPPRPFPAAGRTLMTGLYRGYGRTFTLCRVIQILWCFIHGLSPAIREVVMSISGVFMVCGGVCVTGVGRVQAWVRPQVMVIKILQHWERHIHRHSVIYIAGNRDIRKI